MDVNAELLNHIYQNSQMGVETIRHLLDIVKDEAFRRQLESQFREYQAIHQEARKKLNENGYDEKDISTFAKIRTYLMINLETLTDKSPSHIAEMMMLGSSMGIINAVKHINRYRNEAEPDIIQLMERLLEFEERNLQQLKPFLGKEH